MAPRVDLHLLLKTFCENVYFQPPPSVQMVYPAIIYNRSSDDVIHADNKPYKRLKRYQVTVVDRDPDSPIPDLVAALPMTRFDRFYTAEQLNHDVFDVFF